MAQTIKLRRSAVTGAVPTISQIGLGELAINTFDGKIYFETDSGSPAIETIVTTNSKTTGSIEITGNISGSSASTSSFGTYIGDGSSLTGVAGNMSISEEGSSLTSNVASLNFVGSAVTATNSGDDVTVSITSGTSLVSAFDEDASGDLMPTSGAEIIPVYYELDGNSDLMPRVI